MKLGTRRSLLARTQSLGVAKLLETLLPNEKVELVGIDTRGDQILDIPLSSVEGKEFFVAELDEALRTKKVDFTVHSLKDLSLNRPREFHLAALPKRENPRDIVLFGPQTIEKIKNSQTLKIGTSAPRRLENIPSFLEKALPSFPTENAPGKKPKLEFIEIRGNVNTRLARLQEPPSSERHLDAVVLALAGMNRLFSDKNSRSEIFPLLQNVRWMVLPLRECPTAPGQGALAIECRANDLDLIKALSLIHDEATAAHVNRERALLEKWGGGCHQRFGATAISTENLGDLFYVRGELPNKEKINSLFWECLETVKRDHSSLNSKIVPWDGSSLGDEFSQSEEISDVLPTQPSFLNHRTLFIAHSRALPKKVAGSISHSRVWTSGSSSWFKLASLGIWVEGCAEGLGFEFIKDTLSLPVLGLPPLKDWVVLTHESALAGWEQGQTGKVGKVIATYRVRFSYSAETRANLRRATHIFWNSSAQFEALKAEFQPTACHSTGPGKTAQFLRDNHLNPVIFPSAEEWRKWIHG